MHVRRSTLRAAVAAAALAGASSTLQAQAANYPAFETPRIETRAFNFAIADGDDTGTQLLFQWREGMSPRMQLGLDAGFGDPDGPDSESYFFFGGALGYQLMTSRADMPLDVMLAGGLGLAHFTVADEGLNLIRVPVGVSIGHRFPLERQMAITPFAHPRLILEHCSEDCIDGDDSGFGLGFDVGVNFDLTSAAALRLSLSFANGELFEDQDAIGFGFVWHPGRARSSRR
jgi:hypothetical protein